MKKIATIILGLSSAISFAQSLEVPELPKSGKYEDVSTRGVELCMNLNYILALELQATISEKHAKTPFIDAQELLLLTEFDPYRVHLLNSALLGSFLTAAASDLIDGFVPDEDTIKKVNAYYQTVSKPELKQTIDLCEKYVDIIRPKVDPDKQITLAIDGQKRLLSENLFKDLKNVNKD